VFEPFTRGDAGIGRSRRGLGLGLAVVRGIISAHGGTVAAASEGLGRGTAICLTLPFADSGTPAVERADRRADTAPRRIVLIEDSPLVADGMRFLLEHLGHDVRWAGDADRGIALVED